MNTQEPMITTMATYSPGVKGHHKKRLVAINGEMTSMPDSFDITDLLDIKKWAKRKEKSPHLLSVLPQCIHKFAQLYRMHIFVLKLHLPFKQIMFQKAFKGLCINPWDFYLNENGLGGIGIFCHSVYMGCANKKEHICLRRIVVLTPRKQTVDKSNYCRISAALLNRGMEKHMRNTIPNENNANSDQYDCQFQALSLSQLRKETGLPKLTCFPFGYEFLGIDPECREVAEKRLSCDLADSMDIDLSSEDTKNGDTKPRSSSFGNGEVIEEPSGPPKYSIVVPGDLHGYKSLIFDVGRCAIKIRKSDLFEIPHCMFIDDIVLKDKTIDSISPIENANKRCLPEDETVNSSGYTKEDYQKKITRNVC